MPIEIEYCNMWNYLPEAERVSAEITKATGDEVNLVPGGGGIFEVRRDGEVLYAKAATGRFPKPGEAAALFG